MKRRMEWEIVFNSMKRNLNKWMNNINDVWNEYNDTVSVVMKYDK